MEAIANNNDSAMTARPARPMMSKWDRPDCCDCCDNLELCNNGLGHCDESDRSQKKTTVNPICDAEDCQRCGDLAEHYRNRIPGFVRMTREKFVVMCL